MNPQMGQQGGQGQNPFISAMEQMRNKAKPAGQGNPLQNSPIQANMPPGMSGSGQGQGAGKANLPSNQVGANPGSTSALLKALSSINEVITSTDDPQEIKIARQVILLLQQMLQADQHKQGSKESALGQAQAQACQIPPQIQAPIPSQGGQPS